MAHFDESASGAGQLSKLAALLFVVELFLPRAKRTLSFRPCCVYIIPCDLQN